MLIMNMIDRRLGVWMMEERSWRGEELEEGNGGGTRAIYASVHGDLRRTSQARNVYKVRNEVGRTCCPEFTWLWLKFADGSSDMSDTLLQEAHGSEIDETLAGVYGFAGFNHKVGKTCHPDLNQLLHVLAEVGRQQRHVKHLIVGTGSQTTLLLAGAYKTSAELWRTCRVGFNQYPLEVQAAAPILGHLL
jgi:hypothetical protein